MFRCYFCEQVTPPKTTRHSVVVEVREKQYSVRRRTPKRGGFRNRDESVQDRGGKGVEITKEVDACPTCAAKQHQVKMVEVPSPQEQTGQGTEQESASGDTAKDSGTVNAKGSA